VPVELPADINGYLCCGIQTAAWRRWTAALRTTLDAQVVALGMKDGKTSGSRKRPTTSRATA